MSKPQKFPDTPEATADVEPMLGLRDIARTLNCSLRTVSAWRAEGYLCRPDLVHGKTVRWKRSTVDAWLSEQAVKAR